MKKSISQKIGAELNYYRAGILVTSVIGIQFPAMWQVGTKQYQVTLAKVLHVASHIALPGAVGNRGQFKFFMKMVRRIIGLLAKFPHQERMAAGGLQYFV